MEKFYQVLKLLFLIFTILAYPLNLMAQQRLVTGNVIDAENQEPLPGVNVYVKGGKGTITDIEGEFSIQVNTSDSTLNFSFVGYASQTVDITGRSEVEIQLSPDVRNLDEVVVVGYGVQKKADVTGAVVSVEATEITKSASGQLGEAIQGKLAGVSVTQSSGSPGGNVNIRIRGLGSINDNDPLIVIDGFPTKEGLNNLNPENIASIDVLKDASATAIYGARGANGVIMITTKTGSPGTSQISFSGSYGVQNMISDYEVLDNLQYASVYNDILTNAGLDPYFIKRDGEGNVIPLEEWLPQDSANYDWLDIISRDMMKASIQKYNLSATGGSENARYMVSAGWFDQKGILKGSDYTRLNLRVNTDADINPWLKVGGRLGYTNSERNTILEQAVGRSMVGRALRQNPMLSPFREDGTLNVANKNPGSIRNPLRSTTIDDISNTDYFIGNVYAEASLLKNLIYKLNAGVSVDNYLYEHYAPAYGRQGDQFTNPEADAARYTNKSHSWLLEHTLTYSKEFGDRHDLTALIGYTAQESTSEYFSASVEGFPHPSVFQLSAATEMQDITGGIQEWALLSQLARINYDFDDKYLLTASIRRDGSSRFGEANRYGFFPSFSLGWRISDEAFLNNIDWLTNLKFRAGWGQTGNQEIGNYRHYSQLGLVGWVSGQTLLLNSGVAPLEYPNRGLKWESTEMTNIGLDAGFLNNQITMVLEYYHRGTDGMLLEQPLPGSAGYRRDPVRNVGEITNQGVETIITYKKVSGNFNYTLQLNGAYNKNEVKSLGGSFAIPGASQSDAAMGFLTRTQEGYPMGSFYGWVTDGIFQNNQEVALAPYQTPETAAGDIKFKDLDGDYQITGEDRTFLGSPWPDFTYGFNANIGYRNFSLSVFLQGVYGNEIYFMDRTFYESLSGSLNQSLNVLEDHYWTPENPSQTMPRAIAGDPNANNRFSDRFVEDGSYLRLKNVVLSYDLPVRLIERMRIKGFQVYLKANNLFTLTKFSGLDPEIGEFNNNSLNAGISIGQYPVSRIFTVGLNIIL